MYTNQFKGFSNKKEKKKYKQIGKLVRIVKYSGGFPYHVFVR